MPERIQRKRIKGWRMPAGAVYVGRGSAWGNPHIIGTAVNCECTDDTDTVWTPTTAVEAYRVWMRARDAFGFDDVTMAVSYLRGADLACWCPLYEPCSYDGVGEHDFAWGPKGARRSWCRMCRADEQDLRVPCHADVLLELANAS